MKVNFKKKNVELPSISKAQTPLDELYALLDAGVDVSNYGDPIAFQREAREDARVHNLEIFTHNLADFININGVKVSDPLAK